MVQMVLAVILYVCGFVFLYGVVRLGVRHGVADVQAQQDWTAHMAERNAAHDRSFMQENAFLTGR